MDILGRTCSKGEKTHCTEGINHVRHRSVSVLSLFLNWCVPDVKLELRCRTVFGLGATGVISQGSIVGEWSCLQARLPLSLSNGINCRRGHREAFSILFGLFQVRKRRLNT